MTRLFIIVCTLIFSLAAARAETPVCGGTDLLAALKDKDPALHAQVLAEAAAIPNSGALFWKIERDGVDPSYLLGTAHVTDPRATILKPEVDAALRHATAVALELKELRNQQEMALKVMGNARLMVLPPGQTLWDLIADPDEDAIRNNVNLPPGAAGTLFGYQPWIVAAMLSIPLCEMERKQAGLDVLDSIVARTADELGIPVAGLETVEEQLGTFATMDLELQAKYLVAVSKLGPRIPDFFETLVSLYDQSLVSAYMPLVLHTEKMTGDDTRIYAFVEEDLLRKRNHRMADRAGPLLEKGGAFIAVGALHLPGDEGVVELLRKAGYKVTPAN